MSRRVHTFSRPTWDAASVLGGQIALARRERRWTSAELAERVGVSVRTISALEHGSPTVTIGIAFEAATLVGVNLFQEDPADMAALARRQQDQVALLPSRVRPRLEDDDDQF